MLLFELFLITFFLNVIQSELYESKPGELSEVASSVQETSISLNDLVKSNIKNNIAKRDVPGAREQEDSMDKSTRVQSEQLRHLVPRSSKARTLLQSRGQRRSGRDGRKGRRVQKGRRGRSRGRGRPSRGRSPRRGRQGSTRRGRGRRFQSPAGNTALEEEAAVEDAAEERSVSDYGYDYPSPAYYYDADYYC
uniref:Zgc: n=1 Tax=Strongyloides venezuelensis TaxID=75913 RepID=A0A0K0F3T0_STRVS